VTLSIVARSADARNQRAAVVADCRLLAGVAAPGQPGQTPALEPDLIASLDDPRLGKHKAKEALHAALGGRIERVVLDLLLLLGSISLHIHDDIKPSIESIREKLKELREAGSLLEASEVANVIAFMLTRPRGMTIRDVVMMPTNFDL